MTPTQDAALLTRWAGGCQSIATLSGLRTVLLRAALRIIICHGSRKVRAEASLLLTRIR